MLRPPSALGVLASSALVAATTGAMLIGPSACGNCSRKDSSVVVSFPGSIAPGELATLTATGACGPAPAPNASAGGTPSDDAATPTGWGVAIPTLSAGSCKIHVVLTNGQVFDTDVTVKYSSDCGGFTFVDSPVNVTFSTSSDAAANQSIERFLQASEQHVPFLMRKAERIEDYLQQK